MRKLILFALALAIGGWAPAQEPDTPPASQGHEPDWGDDPDAPRDTRFDKAAELHYNGEFDKAYLIYDAILAERPKDVPTIITYGHMLWKEGRFKEAEQRFKRAIAIEPRHIKARQFLGQMYLHQGLRKPAREQFEALLKLDFVREDVLHSAMLNLGKIALQEEKWLEARKYFRRVRADGDRTDRVTGERGLDKLKKMLKLDEWARTDSKHLIIHFSPNLKRFADPAARSAWAAGLDEWIESTVALLGIAMPDPWHLYVFTDDTECEFMTGRGQAHGWDYGWWLSHTAMQSRYHVKHTLAAQFAARVANRPFSRALVEGFCAYLAGVEPDPHAPARALMAEGRLPTIIDLQKSQRNQPQYEAGMSWVRYLIDTYGLDRFLKMYKRYVPVMNGRQFKIGISTTIDWRAAYDALFGYAFGVDLATAEAGWRTFLGE